MPVNKLDNYEKELADYIEKLTEGTKLHPSLRHHAKTREQEKQLLALQTRAMGHDNKLLQYMDDNTYIKELE